MHLTSVECSSGGSQGLVHGGEELFPLQEDNLQICCNRQKKVWIWTNTRMYRIPDILSSCILVQKVLQIGFSEISLEIGTLEFEQQF